MTASKKQKLHEILDTLQDKEGDTEIFPLNTVFSQTTLNIPFLREQFTGTYFVQPPLFPLTIPKKYRFIGCKPLHERRLAFYDQINYIESKFKGDYLPRESLVEAIEENWNTPEISKKRGNTMITKYLPDNTVALIFAYFPYNIGVMTYKYSTSSNLPDEYAALDDNHFLNLQKYEISDRVSPTKILQIENGISNEVMVRTYYKCFKMKLNTDLAENDSMGIQNHSNKFEFLTEYCFPTEVLESKPSPHFNDSTFVLCNNNLVYILDDNKQHKVPMLFSENNIWREAGNCSKHMDTSFHPSVLFLSNYRQVQTLDTRTGKVSLVIKSQKDQGYEIIYGLRHLQEQYFATVNGTLISIHDVRYPGKPVFDFHHFCDENPLDVLGISQIYDPCDVNGLNSVEDLLSLFNNNKMKDNSDSGLSKDRLLYGFSTSKNGASMILPNKIFEKFETFKDKYSDLDQKDDYITSLMMTRKETEPTLSHLYFEKHNHMRLLFSTSLVNEEYAIRGMNVTHFGKDLAVSVCDNRNNVSFHLLREMDGNYFPHRMVQPRIEEPEAKINIGDINEWSQLNSKIQGKLYQDESNLPSYREELYNKKIKHQEEGEINETEDGMNLEEAEGSEEQKEVFRGPGKEKEEDYTCYNLRPLVEVITSKEKAFEKAYRKLNRKGIELNQTETIKDSLLDHSEELEGSRVDYNRFERLGKVKEQNDSETEEIPMVKHDKNDIGIWKFLDRDKKGVTELPKDLKPFVITKSLVDYLDQSW